MKVTKPIYVANCIEYGERFTTHFQTNVTDRIKLYQMGQDMAAEWGGECISVKRFKPKETKMATMWDMILNKGTTVTERQYNNWVKKHPRSNRYDYSKTILFTETEPLPETIWDCDATIEENMAELKKS